MTRDPYSGDIAVLKGMGRTLRRRVGDYRIFCDLDRSLRRITVLKIDRRTTTTYRNVRNALGTRVWYEL